VGAVESRYAEQRVRIIAAAIHDSVDIGSGPGNERSDERVGQRGGAAGFMGAVRFRIAKGERGGRGIGAAAGYGGCGTDAVRDCSNYRRWVFDCACRWACRAIGGWARTSWGGL